LREVVLLNLFDALATLIQSELARSGGLGLFTLLAATAAVTAAATVAVMRAVYVPLKALKVKELEENLRQLKDDKAAQQAKYERLEKAYHDGMGQFYIRQAQDDIGDDRSLDAFIDAATDTQEKEK
jgi:hypothetical protein